MITQSCIKCGEKLKVKFAITTDKCSGLGILIDVQCKNCNTINTLRKMLGLCKIEEGKRKEYEEFFGKVGKDKGKTGSYIG